MERFGDAGVCDLSLGRTPEEEDVQMPFKPFEQLWPIGVFLWL